MNKNRYRRYNRNKRNIHASIGAWVLLIMFFTYAYATIVKDSAGDSFDTTNLVSPLVVHPVQAAEGAMEGGRTVIECEKGVKEYLDCLAAKGEITQHQADVMLAISMAELSPKRGDWPWYVNRSPVECSVGVFQINLAKDYCNGKWVHAKNIPGNTIDEKIVWLQDPINNTKTAIKIMKTSGFTPWSVYKNKTYLKYL